MARSWAVVAGGGTAGHVVPALAVARALVARGHDPSSVHFVGSRRGLEARLVPQSGFGITLLPGRGIQRRLTPANALAAAGLALAAVLALVLVARRRPRVVLSVGGYASLPCALAAVVLRVPLVLAESNARAGAANRLVSRFARAAAVQFEGSGLAREVVTGNPVRPEILAAAHTGRAEARAALGLPADRLVLAVVGGSLGARRINQAVAGATLAWRDRADLAVRHVVGDRDWSAIDPAPRVGALAYEAVRYEERMDLLLAAADVVVSRAGGSTVSELAVVGTPSVLVPLPIAAEDHQTANARALVEAGAAVLVPDAELTAERLVREVDALLGDPARLARMAQAARSLARPHAADAVAALAEQHARP